MKTIKKLTFFAAITVALLAAGCKKSKTTDTSGFLTKSAWKYTSLKDNGAEIIEDCLKDDRETYMSNSTYSFDKGADDCLGNEDSYTGTWALISNNTKIVYDLTDTANVLQLDDNTFKFSYTDEPTLIFTLTH